MRPRTRDQFEIAIACALPREADAVRAMFDETSNDTNDYGKALGDTNSYTIGRMGQHYVVLAHMPGSGKSRAALVTSSLKMSFPRIQLVLLVGVCGGVPFYNETEIILGDVIISTGVLQYDFGRQYPDGFQPEFRLHEPNAEISSLLAKLETHQTRQKLEEQLVSFLEHAQERLGEKARYPGVSEDRLFEAAGRRKGSRPSPTAPHIRTQPISSRSSAFCQVVGVIRSILGRDGTLVPRTRLSTSRPKPMIHTGLVASGDTVMKSAVDRDAIATEKCVIAFEMEGAGVSALLPCVVIKGVCDYADTHKNKRWQHYAATTAAASAKAFLEYWNSPTNKYLPDGNGPDKIPELKCRVPPSTNVVRQWDIGIHRSPDETRLFLDEIFDQLGIGIVSNIHCVGNCTKRRDRRRCRSAVPERRRILAHELLLTTRLSEVQLVNIARYLLCRRHHQDQANDLGKRWFMQLQAQPAAATRWTTTPSAKSIGHQWYHGYFDTGWDISAFVIVIFLFFCC